MRILELAKRNLKEIRRDWFNIGFLIGMPVAFILIFGLAFGGGMEETLSLAVVNQDQGADSPQFVEMLKLTPHPGLELSFLHRENDAREALRVGDLDGVLIIPERFSQSEINLELIYDETQMAVGERLYSFINSIAIEFSGASIPVNIITNPCRTEEIGYMNYLAPGMTVFGLMILLPASASIMARDKEIGIMPRLLTTPLRPWEFIFGYSLPYIPVIVVQIAIYLGIGYALGMKFVGNFGLAFLILFLLALSSIGLGMILASFIKHEGQAHISWVLIVPMAMLSGAWFETGGMPSVMLGIAKAFPPTYAIRAAQDVISRGLGFSAIANDFYILLGFAVGLFIIGAMLFRRQMLV
jgi:ABC-2 type transport system permease protein